MKEDVTYSPLDLSGVFDLYGIDNTSFKEAMSKASEALNKKVDLDDEDLQGEWDLL